MSEEDKRIVGSFLLIAIFVLVTIAGIIWYETHQSTLVLKTILYVGISGGIGGAAYGIRGFLAHNEKGDFDSKWKFWYLFHPITGFIYGVAAYLLIVGGLLTVGTSSPDYSKGILLYLAISFVAGFGSKKFNEKLDEIVSTLFATSTSTSASSTPAVKSLVVSGFPSSIASGTAATVTVTAKDDKGNKVTSYTGKVTVSSTDSQANITPTDYTYQASDKGVATFNVTFVRKGPQKITATDAANNSITGYQDGIMVK